MEGNTNKGRLTEMVSGSIAPKLPGSFVRTLLKGCTTEHAVFEKIRKHNPNFLQVPESSKNAVAVPQSTVANLAPSTRTSTEMRSIEKPNALVVTKARRVKITPTSAEIEVGVRAFVTAYTEGRSDDFLAYAKQMKEILANFQELDLLFASIPVAVQVNETVSAECRNSMIQHMLNLVHSPRCQIVKAYAHLTGEYGFPVDAKIAYNLIRNTRWSSKSPHMKSSLKRLAIGKESLSSWSVFLDRTEDGGFYLELVPTLVAVHIKLPAGKL